MARGDVGLLGREVRWREVAAFAARHRAGLLIGLGAALRVAQYLAGREFWLDEVSLEGNVVGRPFGAIFGPLLGSQLAPPGFLAVEWLAAKVPLDGRWSLRLAPLVAGVASLCLFDRLARRLLGPATATVALAMFALSDDLIYYASELKPYSSDVAIVLGCGLMGLALADGPRSPRRLAASAAAGAAAVWFALPAVFALATAGLVALAGAVRRRDGRGAAGLAAVGAAWLASFAGMYAVAIRQLGGSRGMWAFWAGAFPTSATAPGLAGWAWRKALYLFVNPLEFHAATPLGPLVSAAPAVALFGLGVASLARRDRRALATALLPVGLALAASAARLYPTHGRTALFLVPSLLMVVAEGAGWLRARGARGWAWGLVLAYLLLAPAVGDAYYLASPRVREVNPYGDRRPVSLDPLRFPP